MFDYHQRASILSQLSEDFFDVIIIGGGITGAGIALDAQSRGLKVALFEMQDFAAGTSSRSTKLIHGGVRYLKQGQIGVVKKTGNERTVLKKLASHLTRPVNVLIPVYKYSSLKLWQVKLGMWFFEQIVNITKKNEYKSYKPKQVNDLVPELKKKDLKGAVSYVEYLTNDSRLTFSCIRKAYDLGAKTLNYTKVSSFLYEKNDIAGVAVTDLISGKEFNVKGKIVINAGGPWVDELRDLDKKDSSLELILTKGIHIVMNRTHFPIQTAIYFEADDQRMIFAIPKGDITYVGTTDTFYNDDKQNPVVTGEDIRYLINSINHKFPRLNLSLEHIKSSWAGLRPLINEEGKDPSEISRKDEIFESNRGLISIAGGKLTGYRLMAKQITNMVCKRLGNKKKSQTKDVLLYGSGIKDVPTYINSLCLSSPHVSCKDIEDTVYLYGTYAKAMIDELNALNTDIDREDIVMKWLDFSLKNEMVCTAADFFARRTELQRFDPDTVKLTEELVEDRIEAYLKG